MTFSTAHLLHAYKQAPWRQQRQWLALTLAAVLTVLALAAVSLQVSARAALLGREIQVLRAEAARLERLNADLAAELARQTRAEVMEQRAQALGFRPARPEELEYLPIPGLVTPPSLTASTPAMPLPALPPEYTQSLWDWLMGQFSQWTGGAP